MKKELEKLAEKEQRSLSAEARIIFQKGLQQRKKEIAIEKYARGEVTLERAAEITGRSVWEMVGILKEQGIAYNLDIETVKKRLKE
ncbi:MAG: hypothetical protein GWO20_04035 [Candidatus Korarchaeota archaeon]|nr:hypothetical protein [Candidatus Korarchaeota archaeon]NIU83996.1 hypothetical protein [Candidatus Thorarchaeota archaeon]NIW13058.1 hypothetical protein [Candidatus Thorarchaeota archaeon]NIW52240.1 hypothetical protein [Candidatus Korarchaeota archaeon]